MNKENFSESHIRALQADSKRDPGLIERTIYAFGLMEIPKRGDVYPLYKRYSPTEFPTYDNYDAIEVGKACDIPMDYFGAMGVPITFMDKFNPSQFELLGATESEGRGFSHGLWDKTSKVSQPLLNGKKWYDGVWRWRSVRRCRRRLWDNSRTCQPGGR